MPSSTLLKSSYCAGGSVLRIGGSTTMTSWSAPAASSRSISPETASAPSQQKELAIGFSVRRCSANHWIVPFGPGCS